LIKGRKWKQEKEILSLLQMKKINYPIFSNGICVGIRALVVAFKRFIE